MLYLCARGVMDVVFSVCIVTRVSSCRCCMFVSCVHHVAVLNAELFYLFILLISYT